MKIKDIYFLRSPFPTSSLRINFFSLEEFNLIISIFCLNKDKLSTKQRQIEINVVRQETQPNGLTYRQTSK